MSGATITVYIQPTGMTEHCEIIEQVLSFPFEIPAHRPVQHIKQTK
jgi:ABC-type enterochelin transport system permease subunit